MAKANPVNYQSILSKIEPIFGWDDTYPEYVYIVETIKNLVEISLTDDQLHLTLFKIINCNTHLKKWFVAKVARLSGVPRNLCEYFEFQEKLLKQIKSLPILKSSCLDYDWG